MQDTNLIKSKVFTNNIRLLTVSLKSVHHNYLVEVAYTSLLHPTEPDKISTKKTLEEYFRRMGFKEHLTGWIVFIQKI